MRIVGGEFRGRKLVTPKSRSIRPTTDKNRESLFNIITHRWPEKLDNGRVLDVFAGTGAVGCEALSRGAGFVVFIEQGAEGCGLLRQNIETLGLANQSRVYRRNATRPGSPGEEAPFDLIFADPPYGKGLGERAVAALAQNQWFSEKALLVLEESNTAFPDQLPQFDKLEERCVGETTFGFFQFVTDK